MYKHRHTQECTCNLAAKEKYLLEIDILFDETVLRKHFIRMFRSSRHRH